MTKEQLESLVEEIYLDALNAIHLYSSINDTFNQGALSQADDTLAIFERHGYKGEKND